MKKIVSIVIIISIVLSSSMFIFADTKGLSNFKKVNTYIQGKFSDVVENSWYFSNVKAVYELGLMKGSSETTFNTNGDITIAEAITLASRIHSIYNTGIENFIMGNPWYQVYVDYAIKNNIIQSNQFKDLTAKATREQFVQIMINSIPTSEFNGINIVEDDSIPDVSETSQYKEAIYKFYRAGVLVGNDSKGTFTPKSNISRSAVATIVTRIVDKTLRESITLIAREKIDVDASLLKAVHSGKTIPKVGEIESFSDHWYNDEHITEDLSKALGLAYSLTVSDSTSISKVPQSYNQNELLEWGKDPGLGVRILHKLGYTGKGATIAYIDQPVLLPLHEQYSKTNLHMCNTTDSNNSMHGPAVLSLLAGKDIGTAPGAEVYYYAHASWERDQTTHSDCLYRIIEQNKSLPEGKKITMVGFSDNIDDSEANADAFRAAVKACEDSGVMVWFCGEYSSATFTPFSDKSNPENLAPASWGSSDPELVYVPAGSRTTAATMGRSNYIYWSDGGLSWTMPYMLGLYASAISIDPTLTQDEIRQLVVDTSTTNSAGMRIINPVEFIATTLERVGKDTEAYNLRTEYEKSRSYTYALMDTAALSSEDLVAIADYLACITDGTVVIIDVAKYSNAGEVYSALEADHEQRGGTIKGVQIFGTSDMVPAFMIDYKVQMQNDIDEGGTILSDLFYGNLNNNVSQINSGYNVLDAFAKNIDVDLIPDWPVARLPLSKGQFKAFFEKYNSFALETELQKQTITNFSNPIFKQTNHSDDMGEFLNRMNKEFKLIDSNYVLYGNLRGQYPVTTKVLGGFTKENLSVVNKAGITELLINSHGQQDNIDCCYFENNQEKRESLINISNINTVLSTNPYLLDCWTCLNGYAMKDNLICTALNGKCVGAFAATTIISNNGVDNKATVSKMQNSNFYYFYYIYLKELNAGKCRSDAFLAAQQAYGESLIKHSISGIDYSSNYQFNLYNLICYENFGVLEPNIGAMSLYENKGYIEQAGQSVPKQSIRTSGSSSRFTRTELTTGKPVGGSWNIQFSQDKSSKIKNQFEFYSLTAQKLDNGYVRVRLEYKAPEGMIVDAFNPPNGDIFMLFGDPATGERQVFEYDLLITDLSSIGSVTMKFFGGKTEDSMFVFYDINNLKTRL